MLLQDNYITKPRLTIRVTDMVIKSKLGGNIFAMAIPGSGKKPGAIAADFDPDKVAGLVERHCDGILFRLQERAIENSIYI